MQERNEIHQMVNPIEDAILTKFDFDLPVTEWTMKMTATEVYQACFDRKPNQKDLNSIKPFLGKKGVQIISYRNVNHFLMPAQQCGFSNETDSPLNQEWVI